MQIFKFGPVDMQLLYRNKCRTKYITCQISSKLHALEEMIEVRYFYHY